MKLKLLTVAVSTLLAAGTVQAAEVYNKDGNKLDLYGKVTGLHYFSSDKSEDGDQTYARLGFKGETQINDQLTGYGQWEYNFSANNVEGDNSGDKTRLAFAGLKWTQTDVFATARTTGVATYRNNGFFGLVDGLNIAVQYQGKEEGNGRDLAKQHGDGWGLASTYEYEGFAAGAAYAASDRTDAQVKAGRDNPNAYARGEKAEVWAAGLKYDANNLYLATTYAETRNMTKFGSGYIANTAQNFEVVAQYQFDFGLRPSIAYLKSKGKDLGRYGDQDLVEYLDVGATYYFNKNMSTYVDYKINLLDETKFTNDAKISTDNIVAVGMTYQF